MSLFLDIYYYSYIIIIKVIILYTYIINVYKYYDIYYIVTYLDIITYDNI